MLALMLCLIAPFEMEMLSCSPVGWSLEVCGLCWKSWRVKRRLTNLFLINCNKTVVNEPLSFLLNFFHYLPIEILENDCSPIPGHRKSIYILKCTVRTRQNGKRAQARVVVD